jgi:basic membrane lipoprotein Med (substrate-binding protein (PBP1-ABC) superfamily)
MLPGNVMQPLVTLRWNWGVFYEKTVRSLLSGGIDAARDDSHAINDWWGLSTGVVDLDMDPGMPEGIRQLAGILKDGIIREQIRKGNLPEE